MKEKFMLVQNFDDEPNWDGFGTHKCGCWYILEVGIESAADAVRNKNLKYPIPEYIIVIKYYE